MITLLDLFVLLFLLTWICASVCMVADLVTKGVSKAKRRLPKTLWTKTPKVVAKA